MQQAVCVRRKESKKKKTKKSRPTEITPRTPPHPGDRDYLETVRKKCAPDVNPRLLAAIDPGFVEIGLVQLLQLPVAKTASVASFPRPVFSQQMVQRIGKKTTHHRHQQSSQRPPQGIPLLQSCEVALE